MLEIKKVEYYVLFECWFQMSESAHSISERKSFYFTSKLEADKYALIDRGVWDCTGNVSEKSFTIGDTLPKYYETAKDCALDNLKAKDFIKHFKF